MLPNDHKKMQLITAELIVDAILDDLTDRRAFRQIWDECDAEVKREIRTTWVNLVLENS